MGIEIQQERFADSDYERFSSRLQDDLAALECVLSRPGFGRGERTIGVELELFLIDRRGRPVPAGAQIERATGSPLITPEMGAFDIELSTPPVALAGNPFCSLREHVTNAIAQIQRCAGTYRARAVPMGILPTFERGDFEPAAITNRPRYLALAAGLKRLRRAPFRICIDGDEPLELVTDNVAMEAANLAFQIHLRSEPEEFARLFNAALMLSGPILAASGNSPTFLGHRLWQETRVALFKQAGDDRPPKSSDWRTPARIGFGSGWVREGAAELFAESVALHAPLLPVCGEEDSLACIRAGSLPRLDQLRLHHGTVWKWNRPVYDPEGDGHLRIELRALPSGPSVDDMLGNAGFLVGAILALAPEVPALLPSFPFELAERNFYRAAQHGLGAELVWPKAPGGAPEGVGARELLLSLLPRAEEGLRAAGVEASEIERCLAPLRARVESGITGAVWQRRTLDALLARGLSQKDALHRMLELYVAEFESGKPVCSWKLLA